MSTVNEKFDCWCIVELFGHAKIAGRCTEQNIAGTNMLRVDVPETSSNPGFTRLFGSSAIYAINPVDETTARHIAERLEVKPIQVWEISEVIKKNSDKLLATSTSEDEYDPGF
jgi:hypothetical protein